jgi:hypothetical protein
MFCEQEADRVADQVLAMPGHPAVGSAPPRIQRLSGHPNGQMGAATPSVEHVLASPGRPLEPALRRDTGQRFGQDFSRVRLHTDAAAEQSARDVSAHAYTVGQDIVFGPGGYAPHSQGGMSLLAHELAHVIQQGSGTRSGKDIVQRAPAPERPDYKDCTESTTAVSGPRSTLAIALDLARRFVNGAICKLPGDPDAEAERSSYRIATERHFLSPTKAQRMGLLGNFKAIDGKLKPENIRCAATDGDQDYCHSSPEGGRMAAFMRDGQIFLCYNFWALNRICQAITLIHEAAHACGFGMAAAHPPYRGSAEYPWGAGTAGKDQTAAIRTDNPDAYGYFAAHVWRDIDTECRLLAEIIEVKGSAPPPPSPGTLKSGK